MKSRIKGKARSKNQETRIKKQENDGTKELRSHRTKIILLRLAPCHLLHDCMDAWLRKAHKKNVEF